MTRRKIVFRNGFGFVNDFGKDEVPRYGAWSTGWPKPHLMMTTTDLTKAITRVAHIEKFTAGTVVPVADKDGNPIPRAKPHYKPPPVHKPLPR